MNAVIFGGTTESRILSRKLAGYGIKITVYVATRYGSEEQGTAAGVAVNTGRLTAEEMRTAVKEADICIDATHPYAAEATANIRHACQCENIPYYRLGRAAGSYDQGSDVTVVFSVEEAVDILKENSGNIMLTTGSKELTAFEKLDVNRLYPRVLPFYESIKACEEAGIPHRNIAAMQGPFSRELNEAMIHQFDIKYLVTKDGGSQGGFPEKIEAVRVCGIEAIVIARPDDEGYSMEKIEDICRRKLTC